MGNKQADIEAFARVVTMARESMSPDECDEFSGAMARLAVLRRLHARVVVTVSTGADAPEYVLVAEKV